MMEEDKTFDRLHISLFCTDTIMLQSDVVSNLVEQEWLFSHEGYSKQEIGTDKLGGVAQIMQ